MKVLLINSVCGIRSTGRICTDIAQELERQGHTVRIAYGRVEQVPQWAEKYAVPIGGAVSVALHGARTRLLDDHGFGSVAATRRFLRWAEEYDPELLWLHNLHGYYINIRLLFDWIRSRPQMQVKWTLHDCWAFTGHCSHFDFVRCDKWQTGCHRCPQRARYPKSLFWDRSRSNYLRKQAIFTGVKDLTLITPSHWLAELVKQSFLGCYPVEVRHNTIDTEIFRPTQGNFRATHGLSHVKLILGVASAWSDRKGLQDFYQLSRCLDPDTRILLVGLDERQLQQLPPGILGLQRTNDVRQLAELYTTADLFFNPTYEDTYPTVNLEAQACGARVVTYRTGGAPETLYRPDARVIDQGDWQRIPQILKETSKQL